MTTLVKLLSHAFVQTWNLAGISGVSLNIGHEFNIEMFVFDFKQLDCWRITFNSYFTPATIWELAFLRPFFYDYITI